MAQLGFHAVVLLIAATALLPVHVRAQAVASQTPANKLVDAIDRVQRNDLGSGPVDALSYVDVIADAKAVQALPILEQYYERTPDPMIKAGVASALVRMGDKKEAYWNHLVTLAKPAVESDAPDWFNPASGNPSEISPELKVWASAHSLSVEATYKLVMFDLPGRLAPLAKTGDLRGILLLRKGLSSPNSMIVSLAAAGLAQAQDKASISLIIEACKRVPSYATRAVAESLLFFDDPRAESTFAFYSPDVNIPSARKFRGYRPFGRLAQPE